MSRRSALLLALLLTPAAARAQDRTPPPRPPSAFAGGPMSWHTVRPGETLRGIAAQFLGSSDLWVELHRLNPGIDDPDRIAPGQRIRVPAEKSSLPAARLNRLSRQVEDQPSPIPWRSAQEGDMLVERDGVRTRQKSSAEMQFLDGARLTLTEDSLVFLHRSGNTLVGTPKKSIEIVQGQAELMAHAASATAPPPEVEIVLGNTRATSRPDSSGPARTRARRSEEGGAKLMAYAGASDVEAGGARVAVPRGMGTSVAPQGPPSPPEPLLPAPVLASPPSGAERACADPAFSWQPVPQAASYVVEVCRDPGCGALVERRVGETGTGWRPAALPLGELYWRVTARSRSGLDGYPSEAARLAVTSERPASEAKETAADGSSLQIGGPQVRVGDRLFVSPAATVTVVSGDSRRWVPVIGGREQAAWPASWPAGEQTAGAVAPDDGCGGRAAIAPVPFVVDAEAPRIRWEVGDREELSSRLAEDSERDRLRLKGRRSGGRPASDAWLSDAGVFRLPLPWVPKDRRAAQFPIEIASDRPQAFFTAPETLSMVDGKESRLDERVLWIAAEDAGAGVDRVIFRTRPQGDQVILEVEARDLVGNVSRKEIRLRSAGAARAHLNP
jgi:LysM repeat protein